MAKKYFSLSQNLRKLLFEKNMKPADLARKLNIPGPTIHRLVTGKSTRPYLSSLRPIAEYFGLSVETLLEENAASNKSEESFFPSKNLLATVPVVSWENLQNWPEINKQEKTIVVSGNSNKRCFALGMNDHSMEPLFPRKTLLIFDPEKKPVDRSYVLVNLGEKNIFVFRQLLIDCDHKYLKPLNPDLNTYKMRLLGKNDKIIACLFESRIHHDPETNNQLTEENL